MYCLGNCADLPCEEGYSEEAAIGASRVFLSVGNDGEDAPNEKEKRN